MLIKNLCGLVTVVGLSAMVVAPNRYIYCTGLSLIYIDYDFQQLNEAEIENYSFVVQKSSTHGSATHGGFLHYS